MLAPGLIALDWGTSSLRAYLLGSDGATVLESRTESWGIMHVPANDFAAAFGEVTGSWRARWPGLKAIASGMIGSAQGWVHVPYCSCPAGIAELAAALVPVRDGALHIVPGIARFGDAPNMMRGEETQIVGALELHPDLAARSLLVLPGTHSKWVRVEDGRVCDFDTYMTGELFALLREHSILGRPAKDAGRAPDPAEAEEAFSRGVLAARDSPWGLAPALFSARALVLAGRVPPQASMEYLSGLLIGEELRCGLSGANRADRPALIGEPALCGRYHAALRLWGVEGALVIEGAAPGGLWHIAQRAGLVAGLP
jgi:2-dehydro-3-deoxygalactonokinase